MTWTNRPSTIPLPAPATSTTTRPTAATTPPRTSTTTPPRGDGRPVRGPTRRRLLAAIAGALLLLPWLPSPPAGAAPAAEAAREFIQSLGDEVMALVQRDLGSEERQAELRQLLNRATDLDLVGRLVLGRHWRSASEEQRAEYTELFRQFVMQNFASRLDTYRGESYEVTGAQVVDDRDAVVTTRIMRPGSPPLRVDWRLRETDGRLAIIDIIAEGVSMVVSQRSEFASVIGSRGMEGLLDRLRQQVGTDRA